MSLVLVANRAPLRRTSDAEDAAWAPALGGLATALLPVVEARGGAWVAMCEPGEAAPLDQPYPEDDPRMRVRRVPLEAAEFEAYYQGMANRVLWPLAHYLLEHVEPDRAFWQAYRAVNRRFTAAALDAAGADADVQFWVHDYHLMLVPEGLRAARPSARIGFFWHVPWPAAEVFRILPSARALVRGVLGADVVGFHTEGYAENFRQAARDLLGATVRPGGEVEWEGRAVRVEAHPIGIDVEAFRALGASGETARGAADVRAEAGVERLIVGVDRLDYTKGLLLRLEAFERFLETYPEYHGRVTLFQVATPSRTGVAAYDRLKRDVDEAVGRINGLYAAGAWVPVRYRYRAYTPAELAVLYRAADVALVTPLRDGMNLVAHEYGAVEDSGVLILSELTGAADVLDGAILVNPYDTEAVVRALRAALDLPEDQKQQRLVRLKASVERLDVHGWADRFLAALDAEPAEVGV